MTGACSQTGYTVATIEDIQAKNAGPTNVRTTFNYIIMKQIIEDNSLTGF